MNPIIIAVTALASICVYVSFYYLWMFVRRRVEKENLTFSCVCISVAIYNFSCAGLYSVDSVVSGIFWQRIQLAGVNLIGISVVWFIYYLTAQKSKVLYIISTILMTAFIFAGFIISGPLTLTPELPSIKHIAIGDFFKITYYEGVLGPIYTLETITVLLIFIWILLVQIRYYRKVSKSIGPVLASFVIYFLCVFNDILVGMSVYHFIYISEYLYMLIVFSMAYVLLNKFVDLHYKVSVLNATLEEKVKIRTAELQKARDALWGEMQLAKKIQTVLLPKKPLIENYEISTYMAPADEVGGDYYDIINVAGKDWVVIGDVSGHGVPAGLVMMMVQTSIQTVLTKNFDLSPSELLTIVNKTITKNIQQLDEDKYMTITVLAAHENGAFYFSGLHQDIMIYRSQTKKVELVETNGMWIGIVDDLERMVKDELLTLNVNDCLLLYTDGITEAWHIDTTEESETSNPFMYGSERLKDEFMKLGEQSTEAIKRGIINSLYDYRTRDDVTLVVLKRLK